MFFNFKNNALRVKHLDPESVAFGLYTAEELRKLCVTKVSTPLTFDSLGHPLPGGLYDKTMGPLSSRGDPCGTCLKNVYQCPGHFGYIELPLPVVNPLFHKIVFIILKMSCFSCFTVQMPSHIKHCFSIQIQLLNCGLVNDAIEVETIITQLISVYNTFENIPEEAVSIIWQFDSKIVNMHGNILLNKNTEAVRNQFVHNILKQVKRSEICINCKAPIDKLQTLKNKIIMTVRKDSIDKGSYVNSSVKQSESKYVTPEESRHYLRQIWLNEKDLLSHLVPVLKSVESDNPTDALFFDLVPVPPINVRPVNLVKGRLVENIQSQLYKEIIKTCMIMRIIIQVMKNDGDVEVLPVEAKNTYKFSTGSTPTEKLHNIWESLQFHLDTIVDSDCNKLSKIPAEGLKQIIEKKAGLLRMHMMGKRVNFSARSVITPDPNLNIDEIGIPDEFAKHLTYPVPVTSWNVAEMRKLIMNGPKKHPGALMVEYEDGSVIRIHPDNETQQESILKRLLTPHDKDCQFRGLKKVYRHLCNGDILLLNRQPTLHKPSIMAHKARILQGEKTIRLHYANCKAYNADFDGDEMNVHFPQNELARSEGYILANVSNQYLVPKDGTPLSGLIQDHMVSGVRLSVRGQFFDKLDYQQLIYQALDYKTSDIKLLPPAIVKPSPLWSGKQVLSTVLLNIIPQNKAAINLTATAKISDKAWQKGEPRTWKAGGTPFKRPNDMSESEVVIREGQLLVGVLDKTHYGATPYGLVHCVYELYGGQCATKLLGALGKLFACFLQRYGFTLGVRDILVLHRANAKRRKIIKSCRKIGKQAMCKALDVDEESATDVEIASKMEEGLATNPRLRAVIDRQYKTSLDVFTNDINKACLPAGLISKFPDNNLQLMVQSGAKGSTVNTMQISCLLGQIELEGKRPPVMISNKSLPSFPPTEFAPRAGGFIDGRFMTGIQPQEFFFHCMAGREGLIDTAVKTSRSGYLQRCLIKHLEGLTVGYDLTVRDSDKSVVQFLYGEDGMDVSKSQFLKGKQFAFLQQNCKAIVDTSVLKELQKTRDSRMKSHAESLRKWDSDATTLANRRRPSPFSLFSIGAARADSKPDERRPDKINRATGRDRKTRKTIKSWNLLDDSKKQGFELMAKRRPDPLNAIYQPDCHYGAVNDKIADVIARFDAPEKKKRKSFERMLKFKSMQSLCPPGEPVGLLAAQSIGEPSTQMTLNTFHFAGRGEMNVTLGIPRLREILMMASKSIKTPSMEIEFLPVEDLEMKANNLKRTLTRVTVADVVEKVHVTHEMRVRPTRQRKYTLRFDFLPKQLYRAKFVVRPKQIIKYMRKNLYAILYNSIKKQGKAGPGQVLVEREKTKPTSRGNDDEDSEDIGSERQNRPGAFLNAEDDSTDEEPEDAEDAKQTYKHKAVRDDLEPEDEERQASETEDEDLLTSREPSIAPEGDIDITKGQCNTSSSNFRYDSNHYKWCEITFVLDLSTKNVDLTSLIKDVASKAVLWEVPGIKRAITYKNNEKLMLKTEGINIIEMFQYRELLNLNKLYCNDIHKITLTYGIEAASRAIVREVCQVFKVYGIEVDLRHLSLIADYMTYNGTFEPLSRTGMETSASPLQQMSFEASLAFLKSATVNGKRDNLQNPSSCLIVGKPCQTGTGSFSLLQKIPLPQM